MEWFIWLFFGHFFGDFAFQNTWMAINKKHLWLACGLHCTIYSIIVTLFVCLFGNVPFSITLYVLIFASHYVLDGTYLVDRWMTFYGIQSWDTHLPKTRGQRNIRELLHNIEWASSMNTKQIVQTIFGALIYVVIDNICHLFMMTLVVKTLI